MDTPSQQSLSEIDESSKVVPKIFVDYSENSTTECTENNSNTSLLRRIMNNAKSILTQKCASLHPSLSSEEPTKETGEYFSNPTDFPTGKVFKETGLKYTSSDYCMVDEDTITSTFTTSKKPYPTSIKVFKRERECKTVSTSQNTEDDLQLVQPLLSNRTLSRSSKRAYQFPYGNAEKDFNGPFEPSEFFHTDDTITNNLMSEGSLAQSKLAPSPKSCPKFEDAEKMPDCNVPCRDDSYGDSHSSSISVQGMMGECETLSAGFKDCMKAASNRSTEPLEPACKKPSSRSISLEEKRWLDIPDTTKNVRESSQPGKNYGSQDDGKFRIDVEISNFRSDRKTTELYDHATILRGQRSSSRRLASEKLAEKRKSDHRIDNSPLAKRKCPAASDYKDQDNQCAFIGSPILEASNFKMEVRGKKCDNGTFGESMTDVISREKNYRSHIQGFRNREKQYDSISNSLYGINKDSGELESTTKALKSENAALKNEIMEMRLDLKHTLEKVQGPMRLKLEAEKSRCHQLQQELQKAFQNMVVSEENYLREMNVLKKQLCMAGTNMDELEQMNKKLKEEMNIMDMLCAKLEDDLIQQKLNEAETIKRLTHKKYIGGDNVEFDVVSSKQESNLHDIARKLSKTIKDCVPCADCAIGIPAELKGAAKLIKELTDMVDSRKEALSYEYGESSVSRTDTSCQSPPPMEEISTQCKDLRTIGTVVSMCLMSKSNILSHEGNPTLLSRSSGARQEIVAHVSQTLTPSGCLKLSSASSKRDSWTSSCHKTPAILDKLSSVLQMISASNDPMMTDKNSSTCNCGDEEKSGRSRGKAEECNNSIATSNNSNNSSNYSSQFPDEMGSFRPEIREVDVDESDTINGRMENSSGYDSKIDVSSKMRVLKRDSFSEESDVKTANVEKSDMDSEETSKKRSKLSVRIDPRPIFSKEKTQEDISEASEGYLREEVHGISNKTQQDIQIPLLVDTKMEMCESPPDNLNVTTSVTESGNLLILTEGPSGIIETVLHYLDDGTIEVVTQITDLTKSQSSKRFYIPLAFKVAENADATSEKGKKSEKSEMDLQQDISTQLIVSEQSPSLSERFHEPVAAPSKDELSKEQEDISGQVLICANLKCVDRNEECVMYKDDKSCNTLVVPTVSNGTLLSTIRNDVECWTCPVKKIDIICGPSKSSFLQQTERFAIGQRSTSNTDLSQLNPDFPQSNPDLPEPVEPKPMDDKPKMNEETICLKEIFHKGTCTEKEVGNDAGTDTMINYIDESTTMSEEKLSVQTSKGDGKTREEIKEKSEEEMTETEQTQENTDDFKKHLEEILLKSASILSPKTSKPASVSKTVESSSKNQVTIELSGKSLSTVDDSLTLFDIDPNQPKRVSNKFRSDECWCPTPCSCKKNAQPLELETSLTENETSFVTDFDVAYVNVKHGVDIYPGKNKKKISIDDVFKKKSSEGKHAVDCECVDCICMPLVRQLATTKEFFVAEDNKQIYQMTACSSPNSKKAFLMPVQKCSNESIGKWDYYLHYPYLDEDTENTDENSHDEPIKNKADKSKSKACCCTRDCVCDQCKIEMMKKEIQKLKNEVNELKGIKQKQDSSYLDDFNSKFNLESRCPEDYICTKYDCTLTTSMSDRTIKGDCDEPKWPRLTCKSPKNECKDCFFAKKQMKSYFTNHQNNQMCHLRSGPICKCPLCTCCGDTCNCEETRNKEENLAPFKHMDKFEKDITFFSKTSKRGNNCCLFFNPPSNFIKDRNINTIRVQRKSHSTSNLISIHPCAHCFTPSSPLRAEKSSKINTKIGRPRSPRRVNTGATLTTHSKSTSCVYATTTKIETSDDIFEDCSSVDSSIINTLDRSKGNYCKDQMQEIQSVLNNIKSVCSEAEEKAKKGPLIKQCSTFGQTMSGLKLALNNLQEKCKSKDMLIEAMTGELRNRTSSISFLEVLDKFCCREIPGDCENYNDSVNNFEERKSKAAKNERIIRKMKSVRTCKCGKIHNDSDYKMVDLKEFEITDISKVTDDSVIIKWNRPKSDLVTGYDIFINGVNKSKVMSGGRTTAMIHSIDLSKNIQVSIHVVTKCGICEPPAVAVYYA